MPEEPANTLRRVRVEVMSTSKPELGPEKNTYRCDAVIRVTEGTFRHETHARLTVHHPRGWMGVSTEFRYEIDSQLFPTFESRAEQATLATIKEFPTDEVISVFLLGTGEPEFV
jgi:hypothetical protein